MSKNIIYLFIFVCVFGSFYMVGQLWLNALRPVNPKAFKQQCDIKEVIVYRDKIIEKPVIKEVIREAEPMNCPEIPATVPPPKCPSLDELKTQLAVENNVVPVAENNEFLKTIDFKEAEWKDQLKNRMDTIWKDHKVEMPSKYSYPQMTEDSSKVNVYDDPNGFVIALFNNVCYNVNKAEFYIYTSTQTSGDDIITSLGTDFYDGFQFRIKLAPFPDINTVNSEGNWMIISHSQRNIAHIMEATNYVLHTAHFPNDYPPIKQLFFPRLKLDSIFPWVTSYLNLVQMSYPEEFRYQQYDYQGVKKIAKKNMICFKNLGISSRLHHVSYGGVFTSYIQVDTLRAITYRHYNLEPSTLTFDIPMVSLLERASVGGNLPGRHISNMAELEKFFIARRYNFRYRKVILESLSPKKQIENMLNTDVLLGALGSGFANVIFLVPGSTAIIVSPPYIGGFFFHLMTELSNVWYLPMYNYSTPIPPECNEGIDIFGHITKPNCGKYLYARDVYIVPGVLENYLRLCDVHLKMYKYPKWQPKKKKTA